MADLRLRVRSLRRPVTGTKDMPEDAQPTVSSLRAAIAADAMCTAHRVGLPCQLTSTRARVV